jgi:hypothetical protein
MVSLLVPPRLLTMLSWLPDGRLDLGLSLLQVLHAMPPHHRGFALGCYDASLEMELALAAAEVVCPVASM